MFNLTSDNIIYNKEKLLFSTTIFIILLSLFLLFSCSDGKKVNSPAQTDEELIDAIYKTLLLSEYRGKNIESLGADIISFYQNIDSAKTWLYEEIHDTSRTLEQWNWILEQVKIKLQTSQAKAKTADTLKTKESRMRGSTVK